jgi:hypothetical protein
MVSLMRNDRSKLLFRCYLISSSPNILDRGVIWDRALSILFLDPLTLVYLETFAVLGGRGILEEPWKHRSIGRID